MNKTIIKLELSIEEYTKKQIKDGYIDEKLNSLKCKCGSKDFSKTNIYRDDMGRIEEYTKKCNKCEAILGMWSYGGWLL